MPIGPVTGFSKLEGKHLDRVKEIEKDTLERLKEVYGENIPQPILEKIEYIIKETYKRAYVCGFNDCYWESH